jgi:hypothetical protein
VAYEAADAGLLSPELAAGIRRVKGVRRLGVRLGNWLTPEQARRLLTQRTPTTPREHRDHAMLAVLLGCGLRRGELLALQLGWIQQREEHWVIADLVGKGGHVRTVPVPAWVKDAIDAWTAAASITEGTVFRAVSKSGRVWGNGMTAKVLGMSCVLQPPKPASLSWHRTICDALVPGRVTWPAANWTRFSSSSGTSRFRRPSATSGASRSSGTP